MPTTGRRMGPDPNDDGRPHFVFGYGSLLRRRAGVPAVLGAGAVPATIEGHRRTWDVAMDNAVDLPAYKYYRDEATGERPAIFVAFLNLRPVPGAAANGVLVPVDPGEMDALDARERNYARTDVTGIVSGAPPGARVWTYLGTEAAMERFRTGLRDEAVAIQRAYLDGVRAGFRALGDGSLEAFRRSTDPAPCPVRDLARIDLP